MHTVQIPLQPVVHASPSSSYSADRLLLAALARAQCDKVGPNIEPPAGGQHPALAESHCLTGADLTIATQLPRSSWQRSYQVKYNVHVHVDLHETPDKESSAFASHRGQPPQASPRSLQALTAELELLKSLAG